MNRDCPDRKAKGGSIKALEDGSAHVIQSALSQGFGPVSKGETPPALHFAQVNEMDGFFITTREPNPAFTRDKLEGADAVLFGGGQGLADVQIRLPQSRHRLHQNQCH